jgi:hypothetical protein
VVPLIRQLPEDSQALACDTSLLFVIRCSIPQSRCLATAMLEQAVFLVLSHLQSQPVARLHFKCLQAVCRSEIWVPPA